MSTARLWPWGRGCVGGHGPGAPSADGAQRVGAPPLVHQVFTDHLGRAGLHARHWGGEE